MAGSSVSTRLVVVSVLVCAAAAATWLLLRTPRPVPPAEAPLVPAPAPTLAPSTPAPEVLSAPLPTPASAGVPEADCIVYPDGTKLPPLNGVKKAPAITFHRLIPFTAVVRKEFDRATGIEWYVH